MEEGERRAESEETTLGATFLIRGRRGQETEPTVHSP